MFVLEEFPCEEAPDKTNTLFHSSGSAATSPSHSRSLRCGLTKRRFSLHRSGSSGRANLLVSRRFTVCIVFPNMLCSCPVRKHRVKRPCANWLNTYPTLVGGRRRAGSVSSRRAAGPPATGCCRTDARKNVDFHNRRAGSWNDGQVTFLSLRQLTLAARCGKNQPPRHRTTPSSRLRLAGRLPLRCIESPHVFCLKKP